MKRKLSTCAPVTQIIQKSAMRSFNWFSPIRVTIHVNYKGNLWCMLLILRLKLHIMRGEQRAHASPFCLASPVTRAEAISVIRPTSAWGPMRKGLGHSAASLWGQDATRACETQPHVTLTDHWLVTCSMPCLKLQTSRCPIKNNENSYRNNVFFTPLKEVI